MTSCAVLSTSASCCVWYPGVDPKAKSSGEAVNGFRVSTSFFLSKVDLSMDLRVARVWAGVERTRRCCQRHCDRSRRDGTRDDPTARRGTEPRTARPRRELFAGRDVRE